MKRVIALYGCANVGKSSTIRKAFELLKGKYPQAKIDGPYVTSRNRARQIVDIHAILTINGVKIGIISMGDPDTQLEERLNALVEMGCQVILCTTRSKGATRVAVYKLQDRYEVLWLPQYAQTESQQETSNLAMAIKIVDEIDKVIAQTVRTQIRDADIPLSTAVGTFG